MFHFIIKYYYLGDKPGGGGVVRYIYAVMKSFNNNYFTYLHQN